MELDESAAPYRAFLRSGSYPALSKRIVNSGGVLVRAAGWFALVVTAASAGYNMTQRFVAQSATAARPQLESARAAFAKAAPEPPSREPYEDAPAQEHRAEPTPKRAAAPALPAKRKQAETGAVTASAHPQHAVAVATSAAIETSAPEVSTVRAVTRALDTEASPDLTVKEPVTQSVASLPTPTAADSGATAASPFHSSGPAVVLSPAPTVVRAPLPPPPPPAAQPKPSAPALPLSATARIDGLSVNGSLTSAHVRHGLERVQPTLSECYASAARRAGENRFSNVRVVVQFDEAGRVKAEPSVEGAQLPGLGACLTSAFSKLVCRAPDTGTAKASMTLHFGPVALAASAARQRR